MKYTTTVNIDMPREKVVEIFEDPKSAYEWMPGLQNMEHISGQPGQPGAKSKMLFKMGRRTTEMIETITKRDMPEQFNAVYEASGVKNIQENYFEKLGKNKTAWTSHNEFLFGNFMMKLMGLLMPRAFKKQTRLYMDKFKDYAERSASN